ncbi:MAG: hypoxanthine phosphoribosyltransferase [Peptoniphilaceae bacterium]|nr:hypoxanthine phosphoribosyltransferase [Peptoniphilaceae bacterium]MDD7383345.1 hypoxanthine phosphoribosyltransferase [Peptoniphilaceae bacterium]MDY3738284.1 hypoxanthine phosphoribosyltransferase [Peptoniphilaceae bacterium]
MKTDYNSIIEKVLIDEESLKKRIKQLAAKINEHYENEDSILLVGILRGSIFFLTELAKQLKIDCKIDFMDVSSYGDETYSSGNVRILKDLDTDVSGVDVLIVEDIIDTGNTLEYLAETLKHRGARTIKIVTLLDKPERREKVIKADWYGFKIPDEYVIGFGMDYQQLYRNLPYIAVLKREVYSNE